MAGKIMMQARRHEQHRDVDHAGKQRRQQRAPRSNLADHYSDYVTIAE